MKKLIAALYFLTIVSGLHSEELVTEKLVLNRNGHAVLKAGYIKHFTDKFPILLDKDFASDIEVSIPDSVKYLTYETKELDPFLTKRHLLPRFARCVTNYREDHKLAAAAAIHIFELHGVEFTSVEGAKLEYTSDGMVLAITNTKENMNRIKKLYLEFMKFDREHRLDHIRTGGFFEPFPPPPEKGRANQPQVATP